MISPSPSSSSINVQVDGQTPESWSAILAQFADANIYQTWAYGACRWGFHNLSHLVIRREQRLLAAAQLRIVRLPILKSGVAYLRWGPLCHPTGSPFDPTLVEVMMTHLREEFVCRRRLALRVVPSAFAADHRGEAYKCALVQAGLRPEATSPIYKTILVSLEPPVDVIRKRLDKKWRNQLNASEKQSLAVEVGCGIDAYQAFLGLYRVMWERKRFETSVDVDQFAGIQERLSQAERMTILLARANGEPVAAVVYSHMGDTGIYLLGATGDRGRELKASYLLHWHAMLNLKAAGATRYDLGGIDEETNPGGYHFKSGFGGAEVTQLPVHVASDSTVSGMILHFIAWASRRRNRKQ